MAQETRFIPCLDELGLQKEFERRELALGVEGFERLIVELPLFFMNHDGRTVVLQQEIIHRQAAGAVVSIGEGMDGLKLSVKVRACRGM